MSKLDLLTANDQNATYPDSYYVATADIPPSNPTLKGFLKADICVIGGGFTGLSTAINLAKTGARVVLLEAHRVGFGASGRNGGQLGIGQRLHQDELIGEYGKDMARALWEIGVASNHYVQETMVNEAIDAEYEKGIAYTEFTKKNMQASHNYAAFLAEEYNYAHMEMLDKAAMRDVVKSDAYHGGVIDWGAGHLDPLKLALGLAKSATKYGAEIYEDSRVLSFHPDTGVTTTHGSVKAEQYVIACNGYLGGLEGETAKYVMPINNFIIATEPLGARAKALIEPNIAVADAKFVVNYFRLSKDDRLLFGGGESYGYRFPRDIVGLVKKPMLKIYPELNDVKIDYAWGGTLAITMSRMPFFRRIHKNTIAAGGYSGHGVALASYGGKMISDALSGQDDEFEVMANIHSKAFPGGSKLRQPILVAAMIWYQMRDKLGI